MATLESAGFTITIADEPTYTPGSADNVRSYDREVLLCDRRYVSSRHAVTVRRGEDAEHSCILLAGAGATTVHPTSALACTDTLYVACGDMLCALSLPELRVRWQQAVDPATCFGVYPVPDGSDLLSHGELSISRVTAAGEILWSTSGADIFSGPFEIAGDRVRAVDWNGVAYVLALDSGEILSPEV